MIIESTDTNYFNINKNGVIIHNGQELSPRAKVYGSITKITTYNDRGNPAEKIPAGPVIMIYFESDEGTGVFKLPVRLFSTLKFLTYLPVLRNSILNIGTSLEDGFVNIFLGQTLPPCKEYCKNTALTFDQDKNIFDRESGEKTTFGDILYNFCTRLDIILEIGPAE